MERFFRAKERFSIRKDAFFVQNGHNHGQKTTQKKQKNKIDKNRQNAQFFSGHRIHKPKLGLFSILSHPKDTNFPIFDEF